MEVLLAICTVHLLHALRGTGVGYAVAHLSHRDCAVHMAGLLCHLYSDHEVILQFFSSHR
jgi:hypothetical protein